MSKPRTPKLSNQILDEASTWFVEFAAADPDQAAREEFIRWLRTSPEHVRAYLQISAHWEEAGALRKSSAQTVEELVALARKDINVVPLEAGRGIPETPAPAVARDQSPAFARRESGKRSSIRVSLALVASLALAVFGGAWYYAQRSTYTTEVGEQRTVTLEDGSTVDLNARSKVRVSFHEHERDIELLAGQALFRVARDSTRPFIVHAGATQVRAVGTQFDVYRKQTGTTVTVVEGRVAVLTDAVLLPASAQTQALPAHGEKVESAPRENLLIAGEQLTVTETAARKVQQPDIAAATAWTQKQIVFKSTSLADVVEEFNRYNRRQLVITDPSLAGIRISGVFSSTDPSSLLHGLRDLGAFTFTEGADSIEISRQ